jgi:hypothetical protein
MTFRSKEKQKMCYSKAKNSNKIWTLLSLFLICLLIAAGVYAQSKDKIEQIKTKEVIPKTTESFKMVADVLDEFGGEAEPSSGSFKMKMCSGGQPSTIGTSQGMAYKISAGYVYGAFVLHGDANGDGSIDITDVIYLNNYLFGGGPPPKPLEAGDVNCDGVVDSGDVTYLLNYLFISGPRPCDP